MNNLIIEKYVEGSGFGPLQVHLPGGTVKKKNTQEPSASIVGLGVEI